jgi:hypothetical protein
MNWFKNIADPAILFAEVSLLLFVWDLQRPSPKLDLRLSKAVSSILVTHHVWGIHGISRTRPHLQYCRPNS